MSDELQQIARLARIGATRAATTYVGAAQAAVMHSGALIWGSGKWGEGNWQGLQRLRWAGAKWGPNAEWPRIADGRPRWARFYWGRRAFYMREV